MKVVEDFLNIREDNIYRESLNKSMLVDFSHPSDNEILMRISNNDENAYKFIFFKFYTPLCQHSLKYVGDEVLAEEVVQETFISFWEKRNSLNVHTSLKSYLYAAVRNNALNYLKSQYARQHFQRDYFEKEEFPVNNTQEALNFDELQKVVHNAIKLLPERCRIIYQLNRSSGMSYQEIAAELEISVKTVEAQMGIALKKLREYLTFHWEVLVLLMFLNYQLNSF